MNVLEIWIALIVVFVLLWVDANCLKPPKLPLRLHKPVLKTLGVLLTGGAGVILYAAYKRLSRPPVVTPRPPVVLKGGDLGEAAQRDQRAADLADTSARADQEVSDAILDDRDSPPADIVERLRRRGVLGD